MYISHEIPNAEAFNKYSVRINGQDAKCYTAKVSACAWNYCYAIKRDDSEIELATVCSFEADSSVDVEVEINNNFGSYAIRPSEKIVASKRKDNKIFFTLHKPGQYSLEIDGIHEPLYLFFNEYNNSPFNKDDENLLYFGPGTHNVGKIRLKSNQTVYIDKNAVVFGAIEAIQEDNIRICGYGIIDGSWEERKTNSTLIVKDDYRRDYTNDEFRNGLYDNVPYEIQNPVVGSEIIKDKEDFLNYLETKKPLSSCVRLYGCTNCKIEGVTLRDPSGWTLIAYNCSKVLVDNIKLFGYRYNSDGFDIVNSQDVIVKNSFFRNFDDCIVLKGFPGWDKQNVENILVENCVLWCDWGRSLEIGAETCAPEYKNIIFKDIYCLHGSFVVLDIQHCDRADISNVVFENVSIELTKNNIKPQLNLRDGNKYTELYGLPQIMCITFNDEIFYESELLKGTIKDVVYRNIKVFADKECEMPESSFSGYDEEHFVKNVLIENYTFNGKKITSLEDGNILIKRNVELEIK